MSTKTLDGLQWLFAVLTIALSAIMPFILGSGTIVFALLAMIPFTLIHGVRRYGGKLLFAFFVVAYVISNGFENLSVLTGFPFGHYHYTGTPKLFLVPIQIGPIYFGLGYVCWLVASTILDRADEHLNLAERRGRINLVALPALAAAVMTAFDVGTDSVASTIANVWIWEEGGGFFGVPFTNYLGWWFVTYLFFQAFAWMIARRTPEQAPRPGNMLAPALMYGSLGLSAISFFIVSKNSSEVAIDAVGKTWEVAAITETMMVTNLFGLMVFAFVAIVKSAQGRT